MLGQENESTCDGEHILLKVASPEHQESTYAARSGRGSSLARAGFPRKSGGLFISPADILLGKFLF